MKKAPYFYELETTQLQGAVILLDVEGTLICEVGTEPQTLSTPEVLLTKETIEAVGRLAAKNTVYLCSNSRNISSRRRLAAALGNVTFHESRFSKPDRAAVADILPSDGRPVIVIGDNFLTDGVLALAINAPCLRVATLRPAADTFMYRLSRIANEWLWRLFGFLVRSPMTTTAITLLSRPPYRITAPLISLKEYIRNLGKHRDEYELKSLMNNLGRGLSALAVTYLSNPWEHQIGGTVCVLHGVDTLRYALEQKRKGFIKTLIAGADIVHTPDEEGNIIKDPLIDKVILASDWSKRWWVSFDQLFDSKAAVWASGVDDRGSNRDKQGVCLVYSKNTDEKVFQKIIEILWTYKLAIVVSHYGKFKHEEYHRLLQKAKMVVYLSEFDTDGSALREAWMANIPALVWSRGYVEYQGRRFDDPEVGAPYMRPECGVVFTGDGDFERKLIEFLERYDAFEPRQYASAYFANEIAARKFLDIVEGVWSKK
jgi:glycosyltransferase involved in cell wall biosynthesis